LAPLRSAREEKNDYQQLLQSLGTFWKIGQALQLDLLYRENLQKIPVPTYAFDQTNLPARVDPLKLLQPNLDQGMNLSSLIEQSAALPLFENEAENGSASEKAAQGYRIGLSTTYVAPEGRTQERVTVLWQGYLGQQQIGVEDDFFELGGDSLKAMSILNAVNQEFDCEIPIQDLYGNPTIKNMSAKIELTEKLKKVTQKVEHKNKLKI
ncbi:MAG: hypothetical protein KDC44_20570, partial [Phaeodactylibacter sp.]|nr:hypothetical protein [Phaeodactylibacter sp.]